MKRQQLDLTLSSDEDQKPQITSTPAKSAHSKEKAIRESAGDSWESARMNGGRVEAEREVRRKRSEPLASSSKLRKPYNSEDDDDQMDLDNTESFDKNPAPSNPATKSRILPVASSSRLPPPRHSYHVERTSTNPTTTDGKHPALAHSTRFWEPTIKETFNRWHPSAPAGLTIPDLLGNTTSLKRVIISSYVLDQDWVLSHFVKDLHIKVLLVHPDLKSGNRMKQGDLLVQKGTNWSWLFPRFAGKNKDGKKDKEDGLYHIKFMILVFDTFTRVVIPSANFMHYDWSDIENSMVIQDFPFLPSFHNLASNADNPTHSPMFSLPLYRLFKKFNVPDSFLFFFGRCDWSGSGGENGMRLVVSNSGTWSGWDQMEEGGGLCSLANTVRDCGFAEGGTWEIEAAGSSIVSYTHAFLSAFHSSASGIPPSTYLVPTPPKTQNPTPESKKLPLSILWHSLDYVERSANGPHGGGTMFGCGDDQFHRSREYYCENVRKKGDVLNHTKSILAIHNPAPSATFPSSVRGYLYIGSANLTSSGAWGALTPPTAHSSPILRLKCSELGVLLPVRAGTMDELQEKLSGMVGYERPLRGFEEGVRGWHQFEYFKEEREREALERGRESGGKKRIEVGK